MSKTRAKGMKQSQIKAIENALKVVRRFAVGESMESLSVEFGYEFVEAAIRAAARASLQRNDT